MGVELEWRTADQEPSDPSPQRRPRSYRWLWAGLGLLVALSAALWLLYWLTQPDEAELFEMVDRVLQAELQAVASGDDALFLSLQADDPAWLAAQFRQIAEMADAEDVRLLAAEQHGDDIWATVGWQHEGEERKRLTFYRRAEGGLQHGPPDSAYWGRLTTRSTDWGELRFHRADRAWGDNIDAFVAAQIETLCALGCLRERLPLDVTVAPDYNGLSDASTIRIASPQLIGLDRRNAPIRPFWEQLRDELRAQLQPATIRFAVPDDLDQPMEQAARDFAAIHPEIAVEIVPFSALPAASSEMLQSVDGAYMVPTVPLITAGQVRDLTPFSAADVEFDASDFYRPLLAGVRWQDRLWAVPQSAQMRLVYYDRPSFAAAALSPVAYLAEIWQRTAPPPRPGSSVTPDQRDSWGFLDDSTDSLHAFASAQRCEAAQTQPCARPMRADHLAAALIWYHAQVAADGAMPDVTAMTEEERSFSALNWLSIPRDVLLWLDLPDFYEHNNQLAPVGVFTLSDMAPEAATPLHISSGLVSQASDNPRAVWQWLHFLSRQRPMGSARSIPARKSVAAEIGYWATLPSPLQEPVLAAFNAGQAVGIEAQDYFAWTTLAELLAADADIDSLADEMADEMIAPIWFVSEGQ